MIKFLNTVPNLLAMVGSSALGGKMISAALSKATGKVIDPELVATIIEFANEIKKKEGFSSIAEVFSSPKYQPEIENLVQLTISSMEAPQSEEDEEEYFKLTSSGTLECLSCGYHNPGNRVIENYRKQKKRNK